jgi:hypothetical protein
MPTNDARNAIARIKSRDLTARKMVEAGRKGAGPNQKSVSIIKHREANNGNALRFVEDKVRQRMPNLREKLTQGNDPTMDKVLTELNRTSGVGESLKDNLLGQDRRLVDGPTKPGFQGPVQPSL